jgi:diamine N-acetyltransferase
MTQPAFLIRRATVADAGLLAELGASTFSETFAAANKFEDMAAYLKTSFSPAKQTEELLDPLSRFLIAECDQEAVGYAKLQESKAPECVTGGQPIELVRLYVSREWLGRGLGQVLMEACLKEVREGGYQTVWLGVWEHNGRAQSFYKKWGFQEVGHHIFRLGSDPQTDLVMELRI